MLWLLWSSLALSAQPAIVGVGEARSVVLLLAPGLEERSVRCDDQDGDGVWTCPAGELPAHLDALGVLVDGTSLTQVQDVTLGDAPEAITLERAGEALRVSTTRRAPASGGGAARPGQAVLMAQIQGGGDNAPRLSVSGSRGASELACDDDGRFPDAVANDGTRTCVGLVEDGTLELSLRLPGAAPRALGSLSWPPEVGLRQVRIDEHGAAVASWTVLNRSAAAPRREDAPRVQGPGSPPPAQAPGPGGQVQMAPGGGGDALQLTVAGALALALFGLGWRLGSGRPGPIPFARALPPPPALPGAPTGSVIFRVEPDQIPGAASWLAARYAAVRPVLVVEPGAESRIAAAAQPSPGAVLLSSTSVDVDDVLVSVTAVARRAITPPVVLARAGALSWSGGLGGSSESALLAALPPGAILVLVLGDELAPVALPEVRLAPREGEWRQA